MDNSFFIYLEQLELMGFFSGYLLIYLLIKFIATHLLQKRIITLNLAKLLPYSYAVVGLLFTGYQLKNLYPDYSIENLSSITQNVFLKVWALLSLLFFIPVLAKKIVLSVLHSLVFFYFILKDLYKYFFIDTDQALLQNDMSIYTKSLLLNAAAFIFVVLAYFILRFFRRKLP
ncbi:hypothetical protein [Ferruginibacter sp.]